MYFMVIWLFGVFLGIGFNGAIAEKATNTYLLLNVEPDGVMVARDLVFTTVETGA